MRQWTVDAFASGPFKGNPACVVEPLDAWPESAWMQALAMENNQAETAFMVRTSDPARFGLRWFTPAMEVPLCGHATLAAAHVLMAESGLRQRELVFDTASGPLTVTSGEGCLAMDFPADPPEETSVPDGLERALGVAVQSVWVGRYVLAVVASEAEVRGLAPDIPALKVFEGKAERGNVIVAALAAAGGGYDVVSRFFAPGSGIAEDPATGSAHCILAPWFAARSGRSRGLFHQACPGRGGDLDCEVQGERVILRGTAVTMIESSLRGAPGPVPETGPAGGG